MNIKNKIPQFLLIIKKTLAYQWPFLFFFLIIVWQHSYIFLYHDDFGYATLSYVGNLSNSINSNNYNFHQIISFLKTHYLTWGGRIAPLFFLLVVLRWDVWVFRIFQSIVITSIFHFSSKLTCDPNQNRKEYLRLGIIGIVLYGLIPINLHNNGTYWASASAMYVWPFFLIFLASYLLKRYIEQNIHRLWLLIVFVLFLLIGLTQEQIIFPIIFLLFGFVITDAQKNSHLSNKLIYMICIGSVVLGFSFLFFAPGNFVRAQSPIYTHFYDLGLLERLVKNSPAVLQITFGKEILVFYVFWIINNIIFYFDYQNISPKVNRTVLIILCVTQLFYLFGLLSLIAYPGFLGKNPLLDQLLIWVDTEITGSFFYWLSLIIFTSIPFFLFSYAKKTYILLGLYLGGMVSQLSCLFIPSINPRATIIFLFSLFPLLAKFIAHNLETIKASRFTKTIFIVLTICSITNSLRIITGYKENAKIHISNQQVLNRISNGSENDAHFGEIHLNKLLDDRYAGAMPYMEGFDYINIWLKDFYQIPPSVRIVWE